MGGGGGAGEQARVGGVAWGDHFPIGFDSGLQHPGGIPSAYCRGEEDGLCSRRSLSPNSGRLLASYVPGVNYSSSGFPLQWVFKE